MQQPVPMFLSVNPSARGGEGKHENTCLFVMLTRTLVGKAEGSVKAPASHLGLCALHSPNQPTEPVTSRRFWFQLHKWLASVNSPERYISEE